ncbi:hypothetical protein ACIBAG_37870 [Streptomyces sp. NPDC051243]
MGRRTITPIIVQRIIVSEEARTVSYLSRRAPVDSCPAVVAAQ